MVKSLEPFSHYKVYQTKQGIEVVLYLDKNLMEFSDELGNISKVEEFNVKTEAANFVKKVLPKLNVKTVKIMAGAMVLSTLGLGTIPVNKVAAAKTPIKQSQSISTPYTVSAGDTLYGIAARYGTTVDAIKQANHLRSNLIKIGQVLRIPTGVPSDVTITSETTHDVVSGDTLYGLAARYGTTVDAIKEANHLSSNIIKVGQTLTIPTIVPSAGAGSQATGTMYEVVSGDTLYNLASRYGTTVNAIMHANQITSDFLQVGKVLAIPTGNSSNISDIDDGQTRDVSYEVVSGDTLYSLAARYGTTVDAIMQANHLSSNVLQVGQRLVIPGTSSSAEAGSSTLTQKEQHSGVSVNQEEVEWLAKMIYSEGRGESLEGQIAIAAVIMNRVESPLFPNNIKDVLFEKSYGYYQFTPVGTGDIYSATPNEENFEAARRAINGEDPTNGALFYYNPDKAYSPYLESRQVSTIIGNHTFSY